MRNKKKNNLLRFAAVLGLAALWVAAPFMMSNKVVEANSMLADVVRIDASLNGGVINGVTPTGVAEYRVDDAGRRRLEVRMSSLNLAPGTVLTVTVDGAVAGTATVTTLSSALLHLETNNGQTVPNVVVGMPVQVTNGGAPILAGVFGTVTATPTPNGSPTGSPTGSPSPSPTGSPSGTPTGTPSPSPTSSPTGSPSPSPTGTPNEAGLFAGLTGPTINGVLPGGYAEFEIHSSRLELEVRVRQVTLPVGTALAVVVDNINVGNLFVESGGEGRLRLRTDRGETVPPVVAGSTISIRNGGATILSGVFAGFAGPSPSPTPTGTPGPTPSPSPAFGRSFESHLTGAQVSPPVQTAATGEIKVTLNAAETQATVFGEFHGLSSNQTGARIESLLGAGGVILDLGVVGGLNGNFAPITVTVSAAQVQMLRTGLWGAVVTSVNNPGGEVRGTFIPRSNAADFDGDGGNDLALFRPSDGVWYSQNSNGFSAQAFGGPNDKVVSGDYDGDGKTDAAVVQSVSGYSVWNIRRSSDGGTTVEQFGLSGDVAARGDFDGDGRGDLAVFRPSNGVWYVKNSSTGGYSIVQFGLAEDLPTPADMDGDGRDDIVVFRPSDGNWYWLRSSDGQFNAMHWGATGDIPVRGDFDGDGKADPTVFRPSTGVWYTVRSTDGGFSIVRWGLDGDVPVAGKFDVDNRTDVAVYRPSEGIWYVLRSTDGGFRASRFGLSGDVPANAR
jgi:hypothetical protein